MARAERSPVGALKTSADRGRCDLGPVSWVVLTNDGTVAADLASRFEGRVVEPGTGAALCEVLLETDSIEVKLCGPARPGKGARPEGTLLFRLEHVEELGVFELTSACWTSPRTCRS